MTWEERAVETIENYIKYFIVSEEKGKAEFSIERLNIQDTKNYF